MSNSAYVRDAKPEEFEDVAIICARAFITDPFFNWAGSVREPTKLSSEQTISIETLHSLPKHIRTLFHLNHSMVLSTRVLGGRILVTVRPEDGGKEKICSIALWLPPGKHVDGLVTLVRSKQYRIPFGTLTNPGGWGITGVKVKSANNTKTSVTDRSLVETGHQIRKSYAKVAKTNSGVQRLGL